MCPPWRSFFLLFLFASISFSLLLEQCQPATEVYRAAGTRRVLVVAEVFFPSFPVAKNKSRKKTRIQSDPDPKLTTNYRRRRQKKNELEVLTTSNDYLLIRKALLERQSWFNTDELLINCALLAAGEKYDSRIQTVFIKVNEDGNDVPVCRVLFHIIAQLHLVVRSR